MEQEELLIDSYRDSSDWTVSIDLIDIAEGRCTLGAQRFIDDVRDSIEYSGDYRNDWLMIRGQCRYGK